jgi:hypothetical protein
MASSAAFLKHDPVLWSSIDFGSVGPLHAAFFMLALLISKKYCFTIIHIFATLIIYIIFVFSYLSIRNYDKPYKHSSVNLLMFSLFFLGYVSGFNHFSNEITAILGLIIVQYIFLRYKTKKLTINFLVGIILGLITFTKLQAIPLAIVMLLLYYYYVRFILFQPKSYIVLFSASIVYIFMFGYLQYYNQLSNFYFYTFEVTLNYSNSVNIFNNIFDSFVSYKHNKFPLRQFFTVVVLVFLYAYFKTKSYLKFSTNYIIILTLAIVFSISKSGFAFDHYYWFLLLAMPYLLIYIKNELAITYGFRFSIISIIYVGISLMVIFLTIYLSQKKQYFKAVSNIFEKKPTPKLSQIEIELQKLKGGFLDSESRMVIFDWNPNLHLRTGILQASHHNIPEGLFYSNIDPNVKKYLSIRKKMNGLFIEDLKKSKTDVILIPTETAKLRYDYTLKNIRGKNPDVYRFIIENYYRYKKTKQYYLYLKKV